MATTLSATRALRLVGVAGALLAAGCDRLEARAEFARLCSLADGYPPAISFSVRGGETLLAAYDAPFATPRDALAPVPMEPCGPVCEGLLRNRAVQSLIVLVRDPEAPTVAASPYDGPGGYWRYTPLAACDGGADEGVLRIRESARAYRFLCMRAERLEDDFAPDEVRDRIELFEHTAAFGGWRVTERARVAHLRGDVARRSIEVEMRRADAADAFDPSVRRCGGVTWREIDLDPETIEQMNRFRLEPPGSDRP